MATVKSKGKMSQKRKVGTPKATKFRPTLFWDVNPKTIDQKKHARYIIERIMDFGNDKEVRWMWNTYSRRLIESVAHKSRGLRPRTRTLWIAMTKK